MGAVVACSAWKRHITKTFSIKTISASKEGKVLKINFISEILVVLSAFLALLAIFYPWQFWEEINTANPSGYLFFNVWELASRQMIIATLLLLIFGIILSFLGSSVVGRGGKIMKAVACLFFLLSPIAYIAEIGSNGYPLIGNMNLLFGRTLYFQVTLGFFLPFVASLLMVASILTHRTEARRRPQTTSKDKSAAEALRNEVSIEDEMKELEEKHEAGEISQLDFQEHRKHMLPKLKIRKAELLNQAESLGLKATDFEKKKLSGELSREEYNSSIAEIESELKRIQEELDWIQKRTHDI
jgi:hypothetical protein